MLQHKTPSTEQPQSAANVRVTPEELAKALAALEARKEQSERETAGTIPIGEAVQQLGFDATPDEIWAEVQTQRLRQDRVMGSRLSGKARRRLWLGVGAGALVIAGMSVLGMDVRDAQDTGDAPSTAPAVQIAVPTSPPTVIKTLTEIPNNGTFYCDEATAQELLRQSAQPGQVLVTEGRPYTGQQDDASWTFTKHDGALYVHGYMAPRSPGAMRLGHIPIYNEGCDETGAGGLNYTQPITLAVGTFHMDDFNDNGSESGGTVKEMTVSDVHPDGHVGDTW